MPTLANINGASLVPDLSSVVGDINAFSERRRESTEQNELENLLRNALGQPGQAAPPKPTSLAGSALNVLGQLAPQMAQAVGAAQHNPQEADNLRGEAQQGMALAKELQKLPTHQARIQRIAQEAGTQAGEGKDLGRLVQLSNMNEDQLGLELQKMQMIGKGVVDSLPPQAAIAAVMARNPALGSSLLNRRDKQIAAEQARRAAAARSAAAARAPKTDLGKRIASLQADIGTGAISPEIGEQLIEQARAGALGQNEGLEDVTDDAGNIIGQRDRETGKLSSVPETFAPEDKVKAATALAGLDKILLENEALEAEAGAETGFEDVFDASNNIVAQRNKATGQLVGTPDALLPDGFDPKTDLGKMIADETAATEVFGEGSPQAAAFSEARETLEKGGTPKLSDVAGLRKEFTGLSGDYVKMRDAVKKVNSSPDTGAGDVGLVFNFMKILDPNSVVRESEFATAENTAGVPERIRRSYNKALTGERLTEGQRDQFKETANILFDGQETSQKRLEGEFRAIAERSNMDPENVVIDFVLPKDTAQTEVSRMSADDIGSLDFTTMTLEDRQAVRARLVEISEGGG